MSIFDWMQNQLRKKEVVHTDSDGDTYHSYMAGDVHNIIRQAKERFGRGTLINKQELLMEWESQSSRGQTEFDQTIMTFPTYNLTSILDSAITELLEGKWVDCGRVQAALGITFEQGLSLFDFSRTADWWSIVGETAEERARNGQKISTCFRVKKDLR